MHVKNSISMAEWLNKVIVVTQFNMFSSFLIIATAMARKIYKYYCNQNILILMNHFQKIVLLIGVFSFLFLSLLSIGIPVASKGKTARCGICLCVYTDQYSPTDEHKLFMKRRSQWHGI